jgi:hypothetical protein
VISLSVEMNAEDISKKIDDITLRRNGYENISDEQERKLLTIYTERLDKAMALTAANNKGILYRILIDF